MYLYPARNMNLTKGLSEIKLQKSKFKAQDGSIVNLVYDEEADILEIFFTENRAATGVELTEHILLRLDIGQPKAISLLIRNFSILTEQTEYGTRSFSLQKLDALPDDLRAVVLQLIRSVPVSHFLKLSHLHCITNETLPVVFVDPLPLIAQA
jgi:hypothetical protein